MFLQKFDEIERERQMTRFRKRLLAPVMAAGATFANPETSSGIREVASWDEPSKWLAFQSDEGKALARMQLPASSITPRVQAILDILQEELEAQKRPSLQVI